MIIKREFIERVKIEAFADKHNLTMEVNERDIEPGKYPGPNERFYANFGGVDVIDGPFYRGVYGNGPNEETAIRDYARKLSRAVLSIRGADDRREVVICPRFAESNPEGSLGGTINTATSQPLSSAAPVDRVVGQSKFND